MRLWALAILSAAGPLAAEPFLALPLECAPGKTCFIEDYVDARPGDGQQDYTCGVKSRDGHRGTDFALLDFDAMEAGVNVLAAADGVVAATRDGVPDRIVTSETRAEIAGRECGNAVRVRHDNGMQTLYCHLKRGSVGVAQGDPVRAGDPLGLVGLSGLTTYPHVHISVLDRDGKVIDPFAPNANTCGPSEETLWLDPLPYDRTGLFTAGFSDSVPEFDAVKSGDARRAEIARDAPLVLYTHTFFAQDGDRLEMRIETRGQVVTEHSETIEKGQAQQFRAFGRRAPQGGWPAGAYRGFVTLKRGDTVLAARHADVVVP